MTYTAYNAILNHYTTQLSPAEAHGIAVGLLCGQTKVNQWLIELTDDELSETDKNQLIQLFNLTQKQLSSDDFSFDLFLPEIDSLLIERKLALKQWCQGFLYALGQLGIKKWTTQAQEIVRDLSEVTKLDENNHADDDENDLIELIEYCRAAVLLLRNEL